MERQRGQPSIQRPHRPRMLFVLFTHNKTRVLKDALQPRIFVHCLSLSMETASQTRTRLCPGFEVIKYEVQ